jgi:hypothetical protein
MSDPSRKNSPNEPLLLAPTPNLLKRRFLAQDRLGFDRVG